MHKRLVTGKSVSDLTRSPDDNTTTPLIIPRITNRKQRKCERSNYIPHKSPKYDNRDEWSQAYDPYLFTMYRIVGRMIEEKYPNISIDWKDPKYYIAFNQLIYHSSSRFITPYIEECNENVTSSKELSEEDKGWEKQQDY